MNKQDREGVFAALGLLMFFFTFGIVAGWSLRTFTTWDKGARTAAMKNIAECEYYEKNTLAIQLKGAKGQD